MESKGKAGFLRIAAIQGAVMIYSFCGVFQKMAARYPMVSFKFFLLYGCSIGILFIYAILWQLILRRVPLTTAYSNRAVAMIWSLVWSVLLFQERVSWNQILGAIIICFGVYKVVTASDE